VFERFTHQARHAIVLAQEEASLLNHNYIGTEHLLLGLIRGSESESEGEGGPGAVVQALQSLEVSLDRARTEVEEMVGQGASPPSGRIPFTPRAKKVLELSLREARQLGHDYIGTEHILLGLVREGKGVAAEVLKKLVEGDLPQVRQQVLLFLAGEQDEPNIGVEAGTLATPIAPRCSHCGSSLAKAVSYRTVEAVNAESTSGETTQITVAYCSRCSYALGIV
jgi:ATP-dependent Clp protease ATP-binding subunit ClpC